MISIQRRQPKGQFPYWYIHCSECGDLGTDAIQRELHREAVAHNQFHHHNHMKVVVHRLDGTTYVLNQGKVNG